MLRELRYNPTAGRITMRQLAEALYPEPRPTGAVQSAQKLLERLEAKKLVGRDRTGPVQTFHALVERSALIDRRLHGIVEQLCDGSLTPLLTQLVSTQKLSAADRQSLRQLIDDLSRVVAQLCRSRTHPLIGFSVMPLGRS